MSLHLLNKRPFYLNPLFTIGYSGLVIIALLWLISQWQFAPLIESSMTSLLPPNKDHTAFQIEAQQRIDQRLNQHIIGLISHPEPHQALYLANRISKKWTESGLFRSVSGQVNPDFQVLQKELKSLQLAAVTKQQWQAIALDPAQAFLTQAERLVNPFRGHGLVPIESNWLGLTDLVQQNAQQNSVVNWDLPSDWLTIEEGSKQWFLLRAELPHEGGIINVSEGLMPLIDSSVEITQQANGEMLLAGGALFAAENRAIGQSESILMSLIGCFLTMAFLWGLFRSVKILAVLIPLSVGFLMGLVATISIFGQAHVFALVIGTSLIGVLIDFPLHWLASGVVQSSWDRWASLRLTSRAFLLSLVITLLGYVALLITPLPILQQTAVFSIAALIFSYVTTLLLLPHFFVNWHHKPSQKLLNILEGIAQIVWRIKRTFYKLPWLFLLVLALMFFFIMRLNTQDDIRQWAYLSPKWLGQAQQVSRITEVNTSSQYLLLVAENDELLLENLAAVTRKLTALQSQNKLGQYQSLDQWLVGVEEQQSRKVFLQQLLNQKQTWSSLQQLGVSDQAVERYLRELIALPLLSIKQSLQTEFASAWRDLYFTLSTNGQVATIIPLSGLMDAQAICALAENQSNLLFVDQRHDLNALFHHTRNLALLLKVASYALAILLLVWVFGWRKGSILLTIPFVASILSVTVFAIMGWTMSLFAIFGLFLVTAIGMDYAIYMTMAIIGFRERLAGVVFAATTTMLSFGVLGFSSIPALAAFGRSVAVGVFFCVLLAISLLPMRIDRE